MSHANATVTGSSQVELIVAGNDLRGDDGAAPAALSLLRPSLPAGVVVWDDASCLDAVPDILVARAVIIADTVLAGGRPGDVCRRVIRRADALPLPGSLHDCGPLAALAAARLCGWAGDATLVGLEPLTLDGDSLSDPVSAAIPAFAAAIRQSILTALAPPATPEAPADAGR